MTQKETSELVDEEMKVVNTAEVNDNSADAEDVPVITINEENEIEDNLPLTFGILCTEKTASKLNPNQKKFIVRNVQESVAKLSNIF